MIFLSSSPSYSATWLVGPQHALKLPSQAAKVARDGDTVIIAAGDYRDDVASWPQNHLSLRGSDGLAHLEVHGQAAEAKAIWVIKGNDILVENMEFSGATVPDRNGAGIRFEGTNLTIRNCHFHHNQMGILTGTNPLSQITIEGSEFNENTVDYRRHHSLGHNIYIGKIHRFTLLGSYVHDAQTGHNVKSRAKENYLLYNRIGDETKASSYLVDFPEGGQAFVIGNQLRQSQDSENSSMLSFAAEHNQNSTQHSLYIVNNTFVNDRSNGIFVNNHSASTVRLINNLLIGENSRLEGPAEQQHNQSKTNEFFRNPVEYNYQLTANSTAINQGINPGTANNGFSLLPQYEYNHPLKLKPRVIQGTIDIGAYELKDAF